MLKITSQALARKKLIIYLFGALLALFFLQASNAEEEIMPTDGETDKNIEEPERNSASLIILKDLDRLNRGERIEGALFEVLFKAPLSFPEEIKGRISELSSELKVSEIRISQLKEREHNLINDIGAPKKPPILDAEPKEPIKPENPSETVGEETAKEKSEEPKKLEQAAEEGSGEAEEAPDALEAAMAQYEKDMEGYAIAYEQYLTELEKYKEEEEKYKIAVAIYAEQKEQQIQEVTKELSEIIIQSKISRSRLEYLEELLPVIEKIPKKILPIIANLKQPRKGARERAALFLSLSESVNLVLERLERLRARVETGSVLGFIAQRDKALEEISDIHKSLSSSANTLKDRYDSMLKLADELESKGFNLYGSIFSAIKSEEREDIYDNHFRESLKESRRLARHGESHIVGEKEFEKLKGDLEKSLSNYETAAALSDIIDKLNEIRALEGRLERLVNATSVEFSLHELAFQREATLIFSSLASKEAKNQVYSFSFALLQDLSDEFKLIYGSLSNWAEGRWSQIKNISEYFLSGEFLWRMIRVFIGILIIFILHKTKTLVKKNLVRLLFKLNKKSFFRKRRGAIAKTISFVIALIPLFLFVVSGYLFIALAGKEIIEITILETIFLNFILYYAGYYILLGLIIGEWRGQPTFINISVPTAERLLKSYSRLFFPLVLFEIVSDLSALWMGSGIVVSIMNSLSFAWAIIWSLTEIYRWKRHIISYCEAEIPNSSPAFRITELAKKRFVGYFFEVILLVWILVNSFVAYIKGILKEGGFLTYLRAKSLKIKSRKAQEQGTVADESLPERYIAEFPLYPLQSEDNAVLLPKSKYIKEVKAQVESWKALKRDGYLVLEGEKGIGKTTMLALLSRELSEFKVVKHTFERKALNERDLIENLSPVFKANGASSLEELADCINKQEEQIVMIDEAHNSFLRVVGGFEALDALVRLVSMTSKNALWILTFNRFAWGYLYQTNANLKLFKKKIRLPSWTREEIRELIVKRNDRTGFQLIFDEGIIDSSADLQDSFELINDAEGFFRLLWEASNGNPRVATFLWLKSLSHYSDNTLKVGLIKEDSYESLYKFDNETIFSLAAIITHENLSIEELGRVLNINKRLAENYATILLEYGYIEYKSRDRERLIVAPKFHQQVLRFLLNKHLLFSPE